MFYYPTVLHRHTGCFATIWLAATKGVRISRREFLTVNVGRTCEDMMDYILVQPGRPRPRFSLYLSSQLQYGIIIVYHRQCVLFLEEVHQALERLLRCERHAQIDMVEPDRSDLTFPDPLLLLEEAEGALDPFFGVMGVEQALPSPNHLAQLRQYETSSSPLCPPVISHKTTPEQEGLTVPPRLITLKEEECFPIPAAEFEGEELPEVSAKEIELLMEQKDAFLQGQGGAERMAGQEGTRQPSPVQISMERDKDIAVEDSMWLTDEIMGLPVEVQLGSVPTELTPPLTEAPVMSPRGHRELGAEPQRGECQSIEPHMDPPGDRQGRRRQLLFIDPGVQISHNAMQAQIADPLVETVSMSQVLAKHPSHRQVAPKELLVTPCTMQLLDDADAFWKKHAALAIFPGDGWVQKGAGLDIGAETELLLQEPIEEMTRDDCSVREVPRELRESGLTASEVSALTEVQLEESRGERSREERSREERSREERSRGGRAHESVSPSDRWSAILETPLNLEGIPEETVELPEAEAKWGEVTAESVLRMAAHHFNHYGHTFFHSLLPPEATRSTAAHIFSRLLELLSMRKFSANQTGPHGVITVLPGPGYA